MIRSTLATLIFAISTGAAAAQGLPDGVWRSDGYGYLVEARTGETRLFSEHRRGCVLVDTLTATDTESFFGGAHTRSNRQIVMAREPTQVRFRALSRLPPACATPLTSDDPQLNFEIFADAFAANYAFFRERGVDWRREVAQARRRVAALPSDGDLFPILVDLVAPLNDGHISIEAGERSYDPDALRAPGVAPDGQPWTWRSLRTSLRDYLVGAETPLRAPAEFLGANRVMHGWLDGDVAYIAILAMGGFENALDEDAPVSAHVDAASGVMDELMARYAGARGVIIDLRVNSGGYDAVALEIASRFAQTPTLAFRKQAQSRRGRTPLYDVVLQPNARARFTGPVTVLIGPDTVSAGETAALVFAALPNAQLVGAHTRGIFSDAIPKKLPNGWTFTLSAEIVRTPEGAILESVGVAPDIATTVSARDTPGERFGADIVHARDLLANRVAR